MNWYYSNLDFANQTHKLYKHKTLGCYFCQKTYKWRNKKNGYENHCKCNASFYPFIDHVIAIKNIDGKLIKKDCKIF